jgi:hypothetical protein
VANNEVDVHELDGGRVFAELHGDLPPWLDKARHLTSRFTEPSGTSSFSEGAMLERDDALTREQAGPSAHPCARPALPSPALLRPAAPCPALPCPALPCCCRASVLLSPRSRRAFAPRAARATSPTRLPPHLSAAPLARSAPAARAAAGGALTAAGAGGAGQGATAFTFETESSVSLSHASSSSFRSSSFQRAADAYTPGPPPAPRRRPRPAPRRILLAWNYDTLFYDTLFKSSFSARGSRGSTREHCGPRGAGRR